MGCVAEQWNGAHRIAKLPGVSGGEEAALGSVCSVVMSKCPPKGWGRGWGWGQAGLEGRLSPSHGAAMGSGQHTGLEVLLRMPGLLQPGCFLLPDPELADMFMCVFNSKLQRNVSYCP